MRLVAVLALVALAAPVAAQPGIENPTDAAPVTLFFHVADFQDFPINTQEPAKDYVADAGGGVTTISSSCAPPSPAGTGQTLHTLHGFSSPGFVEYGVLEDNRPRFHPERGLSYDLDLAGGTITLHWYVATRTGLPATSVDPDSAPLVVPQVTVKATMRTGESVGTAGGYDIGQVIATGQSAPAALAGPATPTVSPGVEWSTVAGRNVYGITVPMKIQQATVPKAGGFSLTVDTFLSLPNCDDSSGYFMPNAVVVHSSAGHRPRMDVQVKGAVRIEYLHPQFVGGELLVHASANSPLGNYDVDANRTVVTVSGPTPATSLYRAAVVQRTHEHGAHTQAVDITFDWPFALDHAGDGTYTVDLTASNDQHTATAHAQATFQLGAQLQVTRCGGLNDTEFADSKGGCLTEFQDAQGNAVQPTAPSPSWAAPVLLLVLALTALSRRR